MARFEVEFLRTNVTVGQFLSYVRAQLRKRGLDELANDIDYDNFVSGDWSCKVDHKERNDEAYVSLGVEYEEVKDMPYDKKSYQRKANGAISNEIVEFIFDDEKTGRGYYYAVELEAESVESTADETTVAESEAEAESVESVESVNNTENDVCSTPEHTETNEQNGDADNLNNRERGNSMTTHYIASADVEEWLDNRAEKGYSMREHALCTMAYGRVTAELETACKSATTAIRRFFKAFKGDWAIASFCDSVTESVTNGFMTAGDFVEAGWVYAVEELETGVWCVRLIIARDLIKEIGETKHE